MGYLLISSIVLRPLDRRNESCVSFGNPGGWWFRAVASYDEDHGCCRERDDENQK
jgi:hypothetical protein